MLLPLKYGGYVFVAGISFSSTEETLTQAFSQYGRVLGGQSINLNNNLLFTYIFFFWSSTPFLFASVDVMTDKVRCRPKGFAYVTFSSKEEADKALLQLNGQVLSILLAWEIYIYLWWSIIIRYARE